MAAFVPHARTTDQDVGGGSGPLSNEVAAPSTDESGTTSEARQQRSRGARSNAPTSSPAEAPQEPGISSTSDVAPGPLGGLEPVRRDAAGRCSSGEGGTCIDGCGTLAGASPVITAPQRDPNCGTSSDISPPWILFCDDGKPIAILPAGRPGEVANVAHMKPEEARRIVTLANKLHDEFALARMERIEREISGLADDVAGLVDEIADADRLASAEREIEEYRRGWTLPGWTCQACGLFTGTAREQLTNCRGCGAPRP